MQLGNREFAMAQETLEKDVLKCAEEMPEVALFCEYYLDSFKKTLDEL